MPSNTHRRTLRRSLTAGALAVTFGLAGQSAAQADPGRDWDRGGDRWDRTANTAPAQEAAPAAAPAAAAPAAAAPAAAAATAVVAVSADLTGKPTPTSTAYSAWAAHVRPVVAEVTQTFGVSTVLTRPGHSPTQQLAADFMVYADSAKGDAVAQYVIDNAARFNVEYVIWKQRIFMIGGSGWRAMEDRGSVTANHYDHVHVSFNP
ncbi:hypothetical protein SAMN05660657_04753 [Geodermatophilus amargosae]|jgi:hypothetical protein|uniref:ARB-07466-like C-terminal domain-containing protein n=1 Tax=Geodermatophilus amargosae TaxID=1296565 RepID=A0A1I7CQH9_9ACTN|nr:hypothetical protein [Geodermatophilus amargosae]SFU01614.1 hypothetical protein SAMN05660657_04753 [Geodermatophilus amargosae]